MIAEYRPNLDKKIKSLLKDTSYYMTWGEEAKATFVAIVKDDIVAVGSLWENQMHPHRNYLGIYIQPSYRRKGIATRIFKRLYESASVSKFQVALHSTALPGIQFLNKHGFRLVRKSYTPELIEARSKLESVKNNNYVAYSDLSMNQKKKLFALQFENYKASHFNINPLNETISLEAWQSIILNDLDENHSFVYLKDKEVVAYLLCYAGENKNEIELGYIGGRDVQEMSTYLSFYETNIIKLSKDFDRIFIEADDVDPFAFTVLNQFEYDETISFDTFIL